MKIKLKDTEFQTPDSKTIMFNRNIENNSQMLNDILNIVRDNEYIVRIKKQNLNFLKAIEIVFDVDNIAGTRDERLVQQFDFVNMCEDIRNRVSNLFKENSTYSTYIKDKPWANIPSKDIHNIVGKYGYCVFEFKMYIDIR